MKISNGLLFTISALLCAGLIFLWWKIEKIGERPTEVAPFKVTSEQPMAAAATVATPATYVSYYLVRGAGAITLTGAVWVESEAWRYTPAGTPTDNTKFLRDVITQLTDDGVLYGVDLQKTKANWLIVLHPGGTARQAWVLDSRDLPQVVKKE